MRMNNFATYLPEVKAFGEGVQYFQDDKGRDFYESRELFKKKYVVFFDAHGVVRGWAKSEDVTRLHPGGLSVVDINTLPQDFSLESAWVFNGKQVVKSDVDPAFTTAARKAGINMLIGKELPYLSDAVEMKQATEEEVSRYNTLRGLRIQLMRISDDTPPTEVDWDSFSIA